MPQNVSLRLQPELAGNTEQIHKIIASQLKVKPDRISHIELMRRSVDARKKRVVFVLSYQVWIDEPFTPETGGGPVLQKVDNAEEVHVIGSGPAGLFAALQLIEQGLKPVVWERGKAVRDRRRDIAKLNKEGIVNPDSNYCFGEGGAGTFSDGKLYTRSTKRGNTRKVLETLVHFGATREILIDAHPHIGTNKLPAIIEQMREQIVECGGEVHFDSSLTGLELTNSSLTGIEINGDQKIPVSALILATGHSARDIFQLLKQEKVKIEAKAFALGVRIEHPQALIDSIQYHCDVRHPNLPVASYSLVRQIENRGVYSFCMCPGGIICPSATANDEVVVNGWSPSKRNTGFANSGIVVECKLQDIPGIAQDPLAAMLFQQQVEQKAYQAGGGNQVAPAQRMGDFVRRRSSSSLPECSYLPGLHAANLSKVLPPFVSKTLSQALRQFGKQMKGYLSNEAVLTAVESRTSSPIRIPRDHTSCMHLEVAGFFPCGEGAGYAGGIMSAAIDGQKVATGVAAFLNK